MSLFFVSANLCNRITRSSFSQKAKYFHLTDLFVATEVMFSYLRQLWTKVVRLTKILYTRPVIHPDNSVRAEESDNWGQKERDSSLDPHPPHVYACTVNECSNLFTDKNIWKLHERSCHSQSQIWQCSLCVQRSIFFSSSEFASHLELSHRLDEKQIDQAKKTSRMTREGSVRFWCGFCDEIISYPPGLQAANKRFDHIGYYFEEGRKIDSWKELEDSNRRTEQEDLERL